MDLVASPPDAGPATTNGVANSTFAAVDPARVIDHLAVLLEATLGATRDELEATGSLLSKARYPDTIQQSTRFATDSQVALYIQKDLAPANALTNGNGEQRTVSHVPFCFSPITDSLLLEPTLTKPPSS